jgi:hypothetical protein
MNKRSGKTLPTKTANHTRAFQPAEHHTHLELRRTKLQHGLAHCNTVLCLTCRKLEKLGESRVLGRQKKCWMQCPRAFRAMPQENENVVDAFGLCVCTTRH